MNRKQKNKLVKVIFGCTLLLGLGVISAAFSNDNVNKKNEKRMNYSTVNKSYVQAFLDNPTNYTFECTPTSKGEVLGATLSDDGEMTIRYQSMWTGDGDHSGVLTGTYDANKKRFNGRYETNDNRFEGEQNLIFNIKGEASGTWDNGYGTTVIKLKK